MSDMKSDKKRTIKKKVNEKNPQPTRRHPTLLAARNLTLSKSEATEGQTNSENSGIGDLEPRPSPGMKRVYRCGFFGRGHYREVPIVEPEKPKTPVTEDQDGDYSLDMQFDIDLLEFETGDYSVDRMRQAWPEHFTKEVEEVATRRRVAGMSSHTDKGEWHSDANLQVPVTEFTGDSDPPRSQSPSDEPLPMVGTPSLLQWAKKRRVVAVPADFVRITKNSDQAIVLAQLCYWFDIGPKGKRRANFVRFGRVWEPKTQAQWSAETGLSVSQVKRAIAGLCSLGFVERTFASIKGCRTTLLRPLPKAIAKACGYSGKMRPETGGTKPR